MNWNEFTLHFLKDSLATLKEGPHSDRWSSGNLALLQYAYGEKIRPWHSNHMFSVHTRPLVKHWNEDVTVQRDIYDISYAPTSMVDNNSEECKDTPKRRTYGTRTEK
ncbi:unnamed protein product [Urochloa humidicola]